MRQNSQGTGCGKVMLWGGGCGCLLVGGLFGGFLLLAVIGHLTSTPEERAARAAKRQAEREEEQRVEKANREAEQKAEQEKREQRAAEEKAPQEKREEEKNSRPEADAKLQANRLAAIQKMINAGLLTKVESGEAWVSPAFMRLDFDDKRMAISIAAAWSFRLPQGGRLADDEILLLVDSKSGKYIGNYSNQGLVLD